MIRLLTKSDIELIINFSKKIQEFDEDNIRKLYDSLNDTKIVVANILNNSITSWVISSIIKNNYYLDTYKSVKEDLEELKDLVNYLIEQLRKDERGLHIFFDNFPYQECLNEIMLDLGFKCNYLSLLYKHDTGKIELIKPNIALNDKSDDVVIYLYRRLVEEIKANDLYLNTTTLIPDIKSIRINNTNVATIRDSSGNITGTLRFSVVDNHLLLDSLYADNQENIVDLLNLVKNLTNKDIEISIYPTKVRVLNTLESYGFKREQASYILNLN